MSGRCDTCGHIGEMACEEHCSAYPAELREAAKKEREANAQVAEATHSAGLGYPGECCSWSAAHKAIAAAIRARKP